MKFSSKMKVLATTIGLLCTGPAWAVNYEVWVSEQTNSQPDPTTGYYDTPLAYGGRLLVYQGSDLEQTPPVDSPTVLDVTAVWSPMPPAPGGGNSWGNLTRIHGMIPSPNHNYLAVAFVASGHLGIIDARTQAPVALFRFQGTVAGNLDGAGAAISGSTASGRQNHLALWSPGGDYLLVSNQNGKLFERIKVTWDAARENIVALDYDAANTIDLVGGAGRMVATQGPLGHSYDAGVTVTVTGTPADGQSRLMTLNGISHYKQHATNRPNNAPICAAVAGDGRTAYVTIAGGGLFVVDYTASPMQIVAAYDESKVNGAGCGGLESGGATWLNAGVWTANVSSYKIYKMGTSWPAWPATNALNVPTPATVYQRPAGTVVHNGTTYTTGAHKTASTPVNVIQGTNADAHGLTLSPNRSYIHQYDRVLNDVKVFHTGTGTSSTWYLTTSDGKAPDGSNNPTATQCGTTTGVQVETASGLLKPAGGAGTMTISNDPSPDLLDYSPHGTRQFVALRGPGPLSVSHAASGTCPGLGVVDVSILPDGRPHGVMKWVLPINFVKPLSGATNSLLASKLVAPQSQHTGLMFDISDPHAAVTRLK